MSELLINQVVKDFGLVKALKGVSFGVEKGEVFGLIGPDGAGKTTLMRILVTLLKTSSGEVAFQGHNISDQAARVRRTIGYMPQRFSLYQDLTVQQNLEFFGNLYAVPADIQQERRERLYEFSRLKSFADRKAGALSGGMKQKLALSCMLMHEPEVMLLDEPTYGVDPVSRNEFWDILQELSRSGVTLLVSTAYMEEAAYCSRVGFIFEGELLASDTPRNLINAFTAPLYLITAKYPHQLFHFLEQTDFKGLVQLFGDGLHLTDQAGKGLPYIQQLIADHAVTVHPIQPRLEDVFLALLGRKGNVHDR